MYCKYCGKEVAEHAFVCPSCGGLIGELPNAQTQPQKEAEESFGDSPLQPVPQAKTQEEMEKQKTANRHQKLAKLSKTFGVVSLILAGIAAFLLMIATFGGISMSYGNNETASIAFIFGWLYAILLGALSGAFGIASFVLGLIQKDSEGVKKLSTTAFVLGLVVFFVSIFFIFSPVFYL